MEPKPSPKSKWKIKVLVAFFVLMGVLNFAVAAGVHLVEMTHDSSSIHLP